MKFTCDRDQLLDGLGLVSRYVGRGSLNKVYQRLYVKAEGALDLRAMNGLVMLSALLDVDIQESGGVLVDPDLFSTIIHTMEHGTIEIRQKKNKLVLTQNGRDRTISTEDVEQFPDDPVVKGQTVFETSLSYLLNTSRAIGFAVAQTRERPILQGLHLSKEMFVAADGVRISSMPTIGNIEKSSVLAPIVRDIFSSLANYGVEDTITLTYGDMGWLRIDSIGVTAWVAQIAGEYPSSVGTIIDNCKSENATEIVLLRNNLIPTLRLASTYANIASGQQEPHYVTIQVENNELTFSLNTSSGSMNDQVACESLAGKQPAMIRVNPGYLLEAIQASPYDEMTLRISEPFKPLTILANDWVAILSPMGDRDTARQYEQSRQKEEENEDSF